MLDKLRNISEEQTQKLIFIGLAAVMFVLPLPQLFLPEDKRAIAMQATVLMFALFYFVFLLVIEGVNRRISVKGSPITVKCLAGLSMVGILSVILSKYKFIALYGSWIRYEGLFSLLAYYSIYLVSALLRNKKYRKWLLWLFLALGSIVAVLGILQFFGICTFTGRFPGIAYVPMRNPNFYASFAVLFLGIAIGGFYLYEKESAVTRPFSRWNRWGWYGLVLLGYAACISATSSVAYVGIIMLLLLCVFFEVATKQRRIWVPVSLILGFLVLFFVFNRIRNGLVAAEFFSVWNQIMEEGSLFGDSVGSFRMAIWKQTLSLLPEHGLFGCGIDQLAEYCFDGYLGAAVTYFDKAHNEYLNLWITEGIFALVFYLIFLFALFIPGLKQFFDGEKKKARKTKDPAGEEKGVKAAEKERVSDEISKIVFFAFFGYIAQAFFNISVVQVAPYFWMICGLLYRRKRDRDEETVDR